MKHLKISCLALFSTGLLSVNTLHAQDTTITRKITTTDTIVSESAMVQDSSAKTTAGGKLRTCELGVRYLPSFTALSLTTNNGDVALGSATMNNGFGVRFGYNMSNYIGLEAEINYEQVNQKYKDQGLDQQVSIKYINIPVLLSMNTNKTAPVFFGVVVGPQFGINMGSSLNSNSSSNTDTLHAVLAVKQGDVGLAYGAGFGIALNPEHTIRLDFGFRGVYGLVNMSGSPAGDNSCLLYTSPSPRD